MQKLKKAGQIEMFSVGIWKC